MIFLGAHLDAVAALRHLGGGSTPALAGAAHDALLGGADRVGFTLGSDETAIGEADVQRVREALAAPCWLNVPLGNDDALAAAVRLKPSAVCLVSDASLRSMKGLDLPAQTDAATTAVTTLRDAGIGTALSVDADEEVLLAAGTTGAETLVLHTGRFARATSEAEKLRGHLTLQRAAASAKQLGHRIHVGGGIDYENVVRVAALPEVEVVHAGFTLAARAVFVGMREAVATFRNEMLRARELATAGQ